MIGLVSRGRQSSSVTKDSQVRNRQSRALLGVIVVLTVVVTGLVCGAAPARAATTITLRLNAPIVGFASTSDGHGYWTVGSDGGVFSFGDAKYAGSTGNKHLNAPIVGMAAGPASGGYWLVASDGGVFSFGNTRFWGSMGGRRLNAPVVGIAATPNRLGYWLVASDGGVFAFGDACVSGFNGCQAPECTHRRNGPDVRRKGLLARRLRRWCVRVRRCALLGIYGCKAPERSRGFDR